MPLSNPRMFQPAEKEIQEIAQETPEEETETTNSIQTLHAAPMYENNFKELHN